MPQSIQALCARLAAFAFAALPVVAMAQGTDVPGGPGQPVPEPETLALVALGVVLAIAIGRNRRK